MGKPNRIREWREERKLTLEALAEASGLSTSYLSRMESGGRNVSLKNLAKISGALGVPERDLVPTDDEAGVYTVGVVGNIAAGGMIESSTEQLAEAEPLFEIEVPFPVPSDAFALQIQGDSMWPRYDTGDVIICTRYSQDPVPLIGFEAAVGTPEGNRYLKRLMRGERHGHYTLESHNAAPIRDVLIAWASEVFGVVRASRWRKLDNKARRREIKKAVA